jgi:hypothetical protein
LRREAREIFKASAVAVRLSPDSRSFAALAASTGVYFNCCGFKLAHPVLYNMKEI